MTISFVEKARLLVGPIALVIVSGCVPEFTDDTSRVTETKIIAVRSVPAEPAPGDTVELSALVVGPGSDGGGGGAGGAGGAEVLEWFSCSARRSATEAGPVAEVCLEPSTDSADVLESIGTGLEVDFDLDAGACRSFGPLPPPADEEGGVGRPASPDQSGGYYQPVVVRGAPGAPEIETVLGSVRLFCGGAGVGQEELIEFNRGYRPNENPAIEAVTLTVDGDPVVPDAGGTFAVPKSGRVQVEVTWEDCPASASCGDGMCTAGENPTDCAADCRTAPVVGCTGAEPYLFADPKTKTTIEKVEEMDVSWFATAGTFETSVTDNSDESTRTSNAWTPPDEAGQVGLWVVLRDSRRGVTWQELTIDVE